MAVASVAFERHEQIARLERARIDGKTRHFEGTRLAPERGGLRFGRCPQRAHAALPRASAESYRRLHGFFRSEKGCVSDPQSGRFHGPCLRSPAHRRRQAPRWLARIAAARSPISQRIGTRGQNLAANVAPASSLRGLSSVTITSSARRAAIAPISGRLPLSRSPPQPNTTRKLVRRYADAAPQHRFQRIRRMGIIDIDGRAACGKGDFLQTPRRALEFRERRKNRSRPYRQVRWQGRGDQRIRRLEVAGERQLDFECLVCIYDAQHLSTGARALRDQLERVSAFADRHQLQAARLRRRDEGFRMIRIGIDDRDTAGAHDFAKRGAASPQGNASNVG